jgi:hypothetical protein
MESLSPVQLVRESPQAPEQSETREQYLSMGGGCGGRGCCGHSCVGGETSADILIIGLLWTNNKGARS